MKKTARMWLLAFVCSGIAIAQSTAGSGAIAGTARDNFGDGLPDTDVVVENQSLGFRRTVGTTDDGIFEAAGLSSGPGYKLKIERKGFKAWESDVFTVPVGLTLNFDIHLQADAGPESERGEAAYTVETGEAGGVSVFGGQQIQALPLVRHSVGSLSLLAPETTHDAGGAFVAIVGRPSASGLLNDGILTSEAYYAQRPPADSTPLDAVEGFQVIGAVAPAEFGNSMGGVVNSASRSGNNQFHGSAYEYYRLPKLTSPGRFSDGEALLQGRNQSGASLGGPVLPGKLFFFMNLEAVSDKFAGVNRITNQLIADPTATTIPAANCKATATQCTAADRFIEARMNQIVPLSMHSLSGLARLDYRVTKGTSFHASAELTNSLAPNGLQIASAVSNGGLLGIRNTREDSRYMSAQLTSALFTETTNVLRFGESQDHIFQPSSLSGLSTGLAGIDVAGVTVGDSNPNSSLLAERRFQAVDSLTVPIGSHTIQVGIDVSTSRFFLDYLAGAPQFDFSSLTNFASDLGSTTLRNYTLVTQTLGEPLRHFPLGVGAVYGQDTWRVSSALTLTLGLRWEKPLTPHPGGENTTYYETSTVSSPNLDLIPRVGIAWRANSKTQVRLGYGFYFAPFTGQLMDALYLGNALSQANVALTPSQTGAPGFPGGIASFAAIPTGASEVEYANGKLRNPHTWQLNLSVERELWWKTTLGFSLIDSHGANLLTASDMNLVASTQSITYTLENTAGASTGTFVLPVYTARSNVAYSHVYQVGNGGSSSYSALVLELRRRLFHNFTYQASYTLSDAIDNTNGLAIAGGVPLIDSNSAFTSNRAASPFDQRHRVVIAGTWQPTPIRSTAILSRYLINGWQLSPVLTVASGNPATAIAIASQTALSSVTPLFLYTMDGSGATSRPPFLPVDNYRTGAEDNLDLRLARTLPFTERIQGLVTLDVFNSFNSQWTTAVNNVAYTVTAGVAKAVPGAGTPSAAVAWPYGTNARGAQATFRIVF